MAREGVDKKRAIAMCHASLVKEAEVASSKDRRRQRRAVERREEEKGSNSDPEVLAALALADPNVIADYMGTVPVGKDDGDETGAEGDDGSPGKIDDISRVIVGARTPEPGTAAPSVPEADDADPAADEEKDKSLYAVASGDMYEIYRPFDGAASWGDYDAYIKARDQARAINDVTYVFQTLVENVMRSDEISPDEKASAIATLATGYKTRLQKSKSVFESLKRALTGAGKNDLPDSAFAYIEPGGKKDESGRTEPRSLRHYPIHDASHIRNALSRAASAVSSGGTTAKIARAALPKIRAAAKREGIGAAGKKAEKNGSGFSVIKAADGSWRWVGWVTNKFRDRDAHALNAVKGGEIVTSEAHREFIEWVYADPKNRMPELWIWHTPGTQREKRADWIDFADGFVVASGPLSEKEAGELLALEAVMPDLGMSHGMFVLSVDEKNGYITKYRSFEDTVLPAKWAANPWTAFSTILKEVSEMTFSEDKRATLVAALGEERVADLEVTTAGMAKTLVDLGIEHKAITSEAPAPVPGDPAPAPPPAPVPAPGPSAAKGYEDLVADIATAVTKAINLPGLNEYLKSQDARVSAIEKGPAKIVAAAMQPKAGANLWDNRPSQSESTKVTDGAPQPAVKEVGEAWIDGAFGASAVPAVPAALA